MSFTLRIGLLFSASLAFAACSSLGIGLPGEEEEPAHPDYETFDPSGYEVRPSENEEEVEHDVPAKLMAGRVEVPDSGGEDSRQPDTETINEEPPDETDEVVEGFRIQVFSSTDRGSAERVRDEAISWWEGTFGESPSTTIAYIEPYYRVRLGGYPTEQEAEAALDTVRERYSDAFTVPDRVQIRD